MQKLIFKRIKRIRIGSTETSVLIQGSIIRTEQNRRRRKAVEGREWIEEGWKDGWMREREKSRGCVWLV